MLKLWVVRIDDSYCEDAAPRSGCKMAVALTFDDACKAADDLVSIGPIGTEASAYEVSLTDARSSAEAAALLAFYLAGDALDGPWPETERPGIALAGVQRYTAGGDARWSIGETHYQLRRTVDGTESWSERAPRRDRTAAMRGPILRLIEVSE